MNYGREQKKYYLQWIREYEQEGPVVKKYIEQSMATNGPHMNPLDNKWGPIGISAFVIGVQK